MKSQAITLQHAVQTMTRIHFAYIGLYFLSIIIFDSWNLITHEGIVWRWQAASVLLVLNVICWYIARTQFNNYQMYKLATCALVVGGAVFAAFNIYWQRGMASSSVVLFAVPIVLSAVLNSRRAIWSAATVCVAAYTFAAVRYFHTYYGEGLKVELYGHIVLFSGVFFILAYLLSVSIRPQTPLKPRK